MDPEKVQDRSQTDLSIQECFSPMRTTFRLIGMVLISFLTFGSYFCADTPGALQDYFETDLDMPTEKFVWLYSIYSWPNVIACFIGGYLLDNVFGIRRGTITYIGLTIVGQLIFATGAYFNTFWLMMVGRLIFGIGAESVIAAQNSYGGLWFKSKELHFSFGMQMSFGGVGSTVNFLVMERIYSYVSETFSYEGSECIGVVLFFVTLTCAASMLCALLLGFMDRRAEKVLKRNQGQKAENARLTDMKSFNLTFWLATLICVTFYISITPFLSIAKGYFIEKYAFEPEIANTASSLVYIIPALTSPFFGIFIDKTGKNIFWITLSVGGSFFAHSLLAFTHVSPHLCMFTLGLFFSLFASSLVPFFALIVPEHQLGTAYGMVGTVQNCGVAMSSVISGIIINNYGYLMLETFFLACLLIGLGAAITIWILESSTKGDYRVHGLLGEKTSHLIVQLFRKVGL